MSMIVYAQSSDLTSGPSPWLTETPPNSATLLRYASILVAQACNRDLYTDAPNPDQVPVLKDATCAQVASWVALGVDPAKAGTDFPAPVKRSTILDATVERDTTAQTKQVTDAANGLCDLSRAILLSAGLLYAPGPMADDCDISPTWGLDVAVLPSGLPGRDPSPFSWGPGELSEWPWF